VRTLLRSCTKLREAIEPPFRLVSGVDPDIGVLDGGTRAQGKGEVLEGFNCVFECFLREDVFDLCVKS